MKRFYVVLSLLCLLTIRIDAMKEANFGLALHSAVRSGGVERVRSLLDNKADANRRDRYGRTPLHYAAQEGYVEKVRSLLDHEGEVNRSDRYGRTPLHYAANGGYCDIAELLLESGAEVNAMDNKGCTSLHRASSKNHLDIIRLLLDYHADIDAKTKRGRTPLYEAAAQEKRGAVELLLACHADPIQRRIRHLSMCEEIEMILCNEINERAITLALCLQPYLNSNMTKEVLLIFNPAYRARVPEYRGQPKRKRGGP